MHYLKNIREQTGDTIVEVLIAISIISLVLVGAYVSTGRNIASTQDAQERSQAVQIVQTQIENLRKAGGLKTDGDCFNASGEQAAAGAPGANPCIVAGDGTKAAVGVEPAYTLSIEATAGIYAVKAQWESLLDKGLSNVTMYYQL